MRFAQCRSAFTMVELMVAVSVLSLVLLAIFSGWTAILRGSKVGNDAAAEVQRTRVAMRALEEALLSAQMFQANTNHFFKADASEQFALLTLVAHLPPSFPGSGMFGNQPLRRVSFRVEPGRDSANELVMLQIPILFELEEDMDESKAYKIILSRNVTEFMVELWDMRNHEWIVPEPTTPNELPRMVRVTLGLGHPSKNTTAEIVSRVVAIPSVLVPTQAQIPGAAPQPGGLPARSPRRPN
jgi:prepilin-type N-terminal cleavage/methylation domain-containing protein